MERNAEMIRTCSYSKVRRGVLMTGLALFSMALAPRPTWGQWTGTNPVWTNSSVGIGTSSPSGLIDVRGWAYTSILRVDSDRANPNRYFMMTSYGSDGVIRMNSGPDSTLFVNREVGVARDFYLMNGNTATILYAQGATGNVGIGTTNPL